MWMIRSDRHRSLYSDLGTLERIIESVNETTSSTLAPRRFTAKKTMFDSFSVVAHRVAEPDFDIQQAT